MTRLTLLASLFAIAACGGKVPETRYYQLATPAPASATTQTGVTIAIEPLETDQAYDDERIVYRVTPYRLDYYNYHRWSSAPGTLVANYLERAFEHSGRFRSVTREAGAASVALSGRVVAIEEIDTSKTAWVGRIVIELRLTETASGTVLWTEQFEEREPLTTQTPEGLAQALSIALKRIANRALPVVSDLALKTAPGGAGSGAKATVSRSARLKP